jgi:outer membrane receptor protein involved in Fe transport
MPSLTLPSLRRATRLSLYFLALCSSLLCIPGLAEETKKTFDLPAGAADETLKNFAKQAGREIVFSAEAVGGTTTNAVRGEFTPREAIEAMLADTELVATQDAKTGAFAVRRQNGRGPEKNVVSRRVENDAMADRTPVQLEKMVVTGSNIQRLDRENALPVSVMTREQLEIRDASTPIDFMASRPELVSVPINESGNLGSHAKGDHSAISLRGLSSGNTLILLNGRRLVPHPISSAEASMPALSVNVNQLPNRGFDRLEILRDGASSVYGTDAVAGVVNLIMRKDFRGAELALRYGTTTDGGGAEWRGTLLFGKDFAEGKGRLVTTLDVFKRQAIWSTQRSSFTATNDNTYRAPPPWNDASVSTDFFPGSSQSAYGGYRLGSEAASGVFTSARPPGVASTLVASSGAFFLVPTAGGGVGFKPTSPSRVGVERDYYFDNNAYRLIQPESRRHNWYGSVEYDLNERVTLFTELVAYEAQSVIYREAVSGSLSADGSIVIPATNPWNPFGTRFYSPTGAPNTDGTPRLTGTPSAVQIQNKKFMDFGEHKTDVNSKVYRGLVGLRGKIGDTWTWEGAALYTQAKVVDIEHNNARKSLFKQALNQTDPTKAYNPFGYDFAVQGGTIVVTGPYVNSSAVTGNFLEDYVREGETSLASGDFRASGRLQELWGGNVVYAAFGGEFRHETYVDYRPPFAGLNPPGSGLDPTDSDFLNFSPNANTDAKRDVTAGYVEVVAPIVGGNFKLPLVDTLELSASGRIESYSDFGTARKPKVGLNWRPVQWTMVRASYNEGFRAPNLAQLFTGVLTRSTSVNDPYRSNVTNLPTDGNSSRVQRRGGNQDLQPEEARGKSAGVVVQVPGTKGLSFSIDYWEIAQNGVITASGSTSDDNVALVAATQGQLAAGTAIGQIDLGSGTSNYLGDPSVVRLPVTQQDRDFFAAYNAGRPIDQQKAVVGAIDYQIISFFNAATQFVNGFDYNLTYRLPENSFGRFTFTTDWTRLNAFYRYDKPGAPRANLLETNGAAKWRGNTTLTWRKNKWNAGVGAYYIGRYQDTGATTTASVYEALGRPSYIAEVFDRGSTAYRYIVQDTITYNAHVGYRLAGDRGASGLARWLADTSVRIGVVNLLNTAPPLSSDSRGWPVDIYTSVARGRSWSIELDKKF